MICEGWALQILREHPGIWEERYRREFGNMVRVEIHDPAPGAERPVRWAPVKLESADVEVSARRYALVLRVRRQAAAGEITVHVRPDGKGSSAVVRYRGDQDVQVTNDRGEPLFYRRFDAGPEGGFVLFLPYAVVKQQKAWGNGIEHGVCSLRAGAQTVNLYLASPEAQVRDWLAYDLGMGLRTWEGIFRSQGYVPTGIGAGDWDRYSDSGGYAHLLSAASQ